MLTAHLDTDARRLTIRRDSVGDALLVQTCEADRRPFVHPIRAPDGRGEVTEDRPAHHPWQHGLYIGLNDVNGAGFWCEGLLPSRTQDGTFHPTPIRLTSPPGGPRVAWSFDCAYRSIAGEPLLRETQAWSLADAGDELALDLRWTLRAETAVRFGRYDYGGLFLRMPFRDGCDATILTSEGATRVADAEQRRARWLAISMRVPGRDEEADRVTVAMMDHPANAEHPVPWRVDHEFGVAPSRCIAGAWSLAAGEAATFRHRVTVRVGPPDAARVDAAFDDFSRSDA